MKKRVLVIAYYWPPSGGAGVQRWVMFVKHLRSFGWDPVIYTPLNPVVNDRDETLLDEVPDDLEVLAQPVFELTRFFGKPLVQGEAKTKKPSVVTRIKNSAGWFIRSNFFIPDPRITWVSPSVKYLTAYLNSHRVDAIVSTGPPNSMHLIAMKIRSRFNIPWLADFRDPWIEVLRFYDRDISSFALRKQEKLFRKVLAEADSLVVAHQSVGENFRKLTGTPVEVITNGYSQQDLQKIREVDLDSSKFKLVFMGILYDALNPEAFWTALSELAEANPSFREKLQLIFVGRVMEQAMNDIKRYGLLGNCMFTGYLDHLTALSYSAAADVQLLFTPADEEFKYYIPGKLFEYLGVGKPVLCLALPENDSARILTGSEGGRVVHPGDKNGIRAILDGMFVAFESGGLKVRAKNIDQFERKNLTRRLADQLNRIVSESSNNLHTGG